MSRRLALAGAVALVVVACNSSSTAIFVSTLDAGAPPDAGVDADPSSGDPDGENDFGEQPLPECIPTSIGIWDDFEEALDGTSARFEPAGTTAIGFDAAFHCGARGIKVTSAERAVFVRDVPPLATPTKAVSWSFLVQFESAVTGTQAPRFAELVFENGKRLIWKYELGELALVEKDDLAVDAGASETVHGNLPAVPLNEWLRLDVRIEYATKIATIKVGPPGGTAPTHEKTLVNVLGSVTAEHLGITAPTIAPQTVRYDRAAVFVE